MSKKEVSNNYCKWIFLDIKDKRLVAGWSADNLKDIEEFINENPPIPILYPKFTKPQHITINFNFV